MKHGKTDKDIHIGQEIEGELFEILEDDKHLPEEQVQAIAKQLVRALHYLHSNRIIHCDMKPQGILICAGSIFQLCDYGFGRTMSTNTVVLRSIKGTPLHIAPELVRELSYNPTADIWSLGVILYELFVGQSPVYTNSIYALIWHIVKDPFKYPDNMSSTLKKFLKKLLNKVATPMILQTTTVCDLRVSSNSEIVSGPNGCNGVLSDWHGLRDGCVGLLKVRLRWGGPSAVQQLCASNITLPLINMLAKNQLYSSPQEESIGSDQAGLSPLGVVWTVSSICQCLSGGALSFRQILLRNDHIKLLSQLISDLHLKLVKSWVRSGGGMDGLRDITNEIIGLLAFPFVVVQNAPILPSVTASVNSGILLYMGLPGVKVGMEERDVVEVIEEDLGNFKILLEVGLRGIILCCLEHLELKDLGKATGLLAKMMGQQPFTVQCVGKGFLDPTKMRRLMDRSSPKEVILVVLMIISDFARMDEARNQITSLLIDRCSDPDKRAQKFACFAIGIAAYHNNMLYKELRRSIPHLANLLLSYEEDDTKSNAAGALSNLISNSKHCEDILSKGALQGTTIGALLYKGGIVGFLDSRSTFIDPKSGKASVDDRYHKLYIISKKFNLYILICGALDRCAFLATHLSVELNNLAKTGDSITVDTAANLALELMIEDLKFVSLQDCEKLEFGGILIGWQADKSYQAYKIMFEQQTVQPLMHLSGSKDLESQNDVVGNFIVGSGAAFGYNFLSRLVGAGPEMSEDMAKACAVRLEHWSALHCCHTGGEIKVCGFRDGEAFDPNALESHQPLDVQLDFHDVNKGLLLLMRVSTFEAGNFMDFEKAMETRPEVVCASLMFSKKHFNYYRIKCRGESEINTLINDLMQKQFRSVDIFEEVNFPFGQVEIRVGVALLNEVALRFIASCQDFLN